MAEQRTTPGMKAALTIAGSDSSGGAGLQADIKTWAAMRIFACSAVTAVTAQNTQGVGGVTIIDPAMVAEQIERVASDIDCQATKTGMIASAAQAKVIAKAIDKYSLNPLIVDPVLVAKSGARLADDETMQAVARHLFPLAAAVTPNRIEAARLLGGTSCETLGEGAAAAREIARKFGCHAVIVKGFERPGAHSDSPPERVDLFWTGEEIIELVGENRPTDNVHGAGCVFSAAIVGGLVQGKPLNEAAQQAKRLVTESIRQNINIGQGHGPVNHLAWLDVKK